MGKAKKEKTEIEATWICARCGRRKEIETEADPVIERVCDLCKISNFCRLVKGAVSSGEETKEVKESLQTEESPEETAVEEAVEQIVEEVVVDQQEAEVAETNITKTLDEQIAELQAKKAELKK